jgi:MoaA/NifB/PqqE/SkfB family radical SAM enzyme
MCSSRTKGFKQDRTLDLEDFGEIIRVLGPHAKTIRINGYGETTIIPNIVQYLDCLDEFNFTGTKEVITNFSAPLDVYKELVKRGFLIIVSWDATEQPLFEHIRHGADYSKMYTNLKIIGHELSDKPERLVILSTIQKKNIKEIAPIVELAINVGSGMVIYNMVKEDDGSPWVDEKYNEIIENFSRAEELAGKAGIKLKIPDHVGSKRVGQLLTTQTSMSFCDRPYNEILIHWDTELTVCNMFNPYSYGTLKYPMIPKEKQNMEKRFRKLWNGPNARLFRTIINKETPLPYCRQCYHM